MLIGITTLVSLFFLGGTQELFLIENLEKNTEELVIDKERKDSILTELKSAKTYIVDFNKNKKEDIKLFKKVFLDNSSQKDEFASYYSNLKKKRIAFQDRIIEDRLKITQLYTQKEWDSIVQSSDYSIDIEKQIEATFNVKIEEIRTMIIETVVDSSNEKAILDSLNTMQVYYMSVSKKVASLNGMTKKIIINRNSSVEELFSLRDEMNTLRLKTYNSLVNFRFTLSEYCAEDEWTPIIKKVNSLIE